MANGKTLVDSGILRLQPYFDRICKIWPKDDSKFIDMISKHIFNELNDGPLHAGENLVGGTESIEGLALDVSSSEVNICGKTFTKLYNLRLLQLYIGSWNKLRDINGKIRQSKFGTETKVKATSGGLEYLSSELRLFCWHGYPFQNLPSTFYPESLVVLDLSYSGRREEIQTKSWGLILWPSFSSRKMHHPPSAVFHSLSSLRFLRNVDVSHCNLTEASVDGIDCLSMLETLNLSGNDFTSLPTLSQLFRLETLGLVGCKNIQAMPELPPNIQLIEAQDCTSLRGLPEKSTIIPGWFSNQSTGDCIKVELPPAWCYENFKGIALCLVFSPRNLDGRKSSYGSIVYGFKIFDGTPIGKESPIPDSIFQYENIGIKSDQILLCYHQSEPNWKKAKNFISVCFQVYGADCVVKMCGARLVCEEDEQQE
ncbi:Leucine-rich repeat-containing protein, partial [Cynara cardunculus var. scolymus]